MDMVDDLGIELARSHYNCSRFQSAYLMSRSSIVLGMSTPQSNSGHGDTHLKDVVVLGALTNQLALVDNSTDGLPSQWPVSSKLARYQPSDHPADRSTWQRGLNVNSYPVSLNQSVGI